MSVLQMTPCILSDAWSEFIEWSARLLDIPVACRFDDQGWGRLSASSPGVTVIKSEHFAGSSGGQSTVVELEVAQLKIVVGRALEHGAKLVTEPLEMSERQWHAAIESPQGILLWLWESEDTAASASTVHDGPVHFTVERIVQSAPERVFEAVTRVEHLTKYFVDRATADLAVGNDVVWSWDEDGEGDVEVLELTPNEYVAFRWRAYRRPYDTRAHFSITPVPGGTRIAVTESGWDDDTSGLQSAFNHCMGWTQFVDGLKAYLEHGIALR